MQRVTGIVLIAGASFYLGWVAKGRFDEPVQPPQLSAARIPGPQAMPPRDTDTAETRPQPATAAQPESYSQTFRELLLKQAFEEAMLLFERAQAHDEALALLLRADVLSYLQSALEQQQNHGLMNLADAYLSRYYDDIDVLMILAEYQRRQGYPEEAAQVIQFAFTYAHQSAQREKVAAFSQVLVEKTDALFAQQQRWVELLGFYELLESIDLGQPRYRLRQAMIYMQLEDFSRATALLLPLAEQGEWADKASELLAGAYAHTDDFPGTVAAVTSIPLLRHGSHYVIKARLNGASDVVLMLDTGASITSLSQRGFDAVAGQSSFKNLGSRLFNTVNGVTRGDVYNVEHFNLGDQVLSDVKLAVLDFQQNPGIDGLLGMNVLQYFRFEIDQDRQLLHLQPR